MKNLNINNIKIYIGDNNVEEIVVELNSINPITLKNFELFCHVPKNKGEDIALKCFGIKPEVIDLRIRKLSINKNHKEGGVFVFDKEQNKFVRSYLNNEMK